MSYDIVNMNNALTHIDFAQNYVFNINLLYCSLTQIETLFFNIGNFRIVCNPLKN